MMSDLWTSRFCFVSTNKNKIKQMSIGLLFSHEHYKAFSCEGILFHSFVTYYLLSFMKNAERVFTGTQIVPDKRSKGLRYLVCRLFVLLQLPSSKWDFISRATQQNHKRLQHSEIKRKTKLYIPQTLQKKSSTQTAIKWCAIKVN